MFDAELLKRVWTEQAEIKKSVAKINHLCARQIEEIDLNRRMETDRLREIYRRLIQLENDIKGRPPETPVDEEKIEQEAK